MLNDGSLTCTVKPRVLIIDDDEEICLSLSDALSHSGLTTACATTGMAGLERKRSFSPNVILLDFGLPDIHGITLLPLLAEQGDCGIIIVSGSDDEVDWIVGLELGADDYIRKPPHLRELLARVRAVNRRVSLRGRAGIDRTRRSTIRLGAVTIDFANRSVHDADGVVLKITAAEFAVLKTLVDARGEVVSRTALSEAALRRPWQHDDRAVDQLVFSLRSKIEAGWGQQLIRSVRCAGYAVIGLSPV